MVSLPDDGNLLSDFQTLVETGVGERDREGWNRCRIALVGHRQRGDADDLERAFAGLAGSDEKLHLHWVTEESLSIDTA